MAICDLLLLKNIREDWKERRKIRLEWSARATSQKAMAKEPGLSSADEGAAVNF